MALDFTALDNHMFQMYGSLIKEYIFSENYYRKIKAAKGQDERIRLYKEYCALTGIPLNKQFMEKLRTI